jgi:predicted Zn-dependent protease with MMP-like domain
MDARRFQELVDETLEDLPEEFASRLENVEVLVERRPPRRLLRRMGLSDRDTLLGFYHGVPFSHRDTGYGNVLPDRVAIYRDPVLEAATEACRRDEDFEEAVRREVRRTVLHEIGHYFGLDEGDLRQLDY